MADGGYSVSTLGFDTFVLGVGAQKSGTTWVYDYLNRHPQCDMPTMKEMHFFDLLFQNDKFEFKKLKERVLAQHARIRNRPGAAARRRAVELESRISIANDFERYLEFFQNMGIQTRATGDITPTYASLTADQYRRIADYLRAAGLRVRVVFLMRDPIERYLSAVRMMSGKMGATENDARQVKQVMMQRLRGPQNAARGRYDLTVRNLQSAFEPDELYIQFFEHFFQQDEIRRLCEFIGIDYFPADLERSPNATRRDSLELTAAERAQIYDTLRPVYEGCREIFGDRVPEGWAKAP